MKVRTRNQGGSIASFAAVGIVLAVVLIGGLYIVQRYAATSNDSREVATNNSSNDDGKTTYEPVVDDKNTASPNTSVSSDGTANDENTTQDESSTPSATASELPETGPASSIVNMIAVSSLAFAAVSYMRSKRASLDF